MSNNVHGTFVSEKVNKIRWRPDSLNESHYFMTGSWDNYENSLKLWDFQLNEDSEIYPNLIAEHNYQGDVTEMLFLNEDHIVTASSEGSVHIFKITSNYGTDTLLTPTVSWENIHKYRTSCTALAVCDSSIVSVGEDGQIILLNSNKQNIVREIENADSSSICCVVFLKHNEILTSNLRGQMKIWDLRSDSDLPQSTFMLSNEQITPTCLQYHPTQRHLVVAGDEEGTITIWDLRKNTTPVNMLSAHESTITEIQFHPDYSDHLFSCSTSGDIWHWAPKQNLISNIVTMETNNAPVTESSNVWLTSKDIKHKLDVYTLMPKLHKSINSLDLNKNKIICGCDNEAIYLISCSNIFHL